jgi:hypothetical protein
MVQCGAWELIVERGQPIIRGVCEAAQGAPPEKKFTHGKRDPEQVQQVSPTAFRTAGRGPCVPSHRATAAYSLHGPLKSHSPPSQPYGGLVCFKVSVSPAVPSYSPGSQIVVGFFGALG